MNDWIENPDNFVDQDNIKIQREKWGLYEWYSTILLLLFFPPAGIALLIIRWVLKKDVFNQ